MKENIFLFGPNIVGYIRIIFNLASWWFMTTDPVYAGALYISAGLLDAIDGHTARMLKQGTRFGAMLDQLTDRTAIMSLSMTLCLFYPKWMFVLQVVTAIDIAGHWLHQHVMLLSGEKSHKNIDKDGNPILRFYYSSKVVLFSMVAGSELFYSSVYLLYFFEGPTVVHGIGLWKLFAIISCPIAIVKAIISAAHLFDAARRIGRIDANERLEHVS